MHRGVVPLLSQTLASILNERGMCSEEPETALLAWSREAVMAFSKLNSSPTGWRKGL